MSTKPIEQTLFFFKPDALMHSLTGQVLNRISDTFNAIVAERGGKIGISYPAQKIVSPTRELLEVHYAHLKEKPFFPFTIDYVLGLHHYTEEWGREREIDPEEVTRYRRLFVYAIAGERVTQIVRDVLGPTDPEEAKADAENSIRAQHGVRKPILDQNDNTKILYYVFYNVAHASNEGDQKRELKLWFKPNEFSHSDYREALGCVPCERCHYYLTSDERIIDHYEPSSLCIATPGDMIWESDKEILEDHLQHGKDAKSNLNIAVAKHKVNLD